MLDVSQINVAQIVYIGYNCLCYDCPKQTKYIQSVI